MRGYPLSGPSLRHQAPRVDRRSFVLRLPLALPSDGHPRDAPVVVAGVLAGARDEEVLLLVDHVLPDVLAHLHVRRELDGVGGAGILAEPAEDAPREVDPEEL